MRRELTDHVKNVVPGATCIEISTTVGTDTPIVSRGAIVRDIGTLRTPVRCTGSNACTRSNRGSMGGPKDVPTAGRARAERTSASVSVQPRTRARRAVPGDDDVHCSKDARPAALDGGLVSHDSLFRASG